MKPTIEKTITLSNGFEQAVIIHKFGYACDTGTCTFTDDAKVSVTVPDDGSFGISYRYSDTRDDDPVPRGLVFVGLRAFRAKFPEVEITIG